MASKRQCKHCRKSFIPRPQNPNQQYCSESVCQKARKRDWQKCKRQNDSAYRENQRDANKRWRDKNPDYQREYRARNTEYTERNSRQQKVRNQQRAIRISPPSIVKMDASPCENHLNTGRYELRLVENGIVKMDSSIIEINVISSG